MQERLQNVRCQLQALHADAVLVMDSTNLFYLTGLTLSCGQLLIYEQGAILLVDGRYFEAAQKCPGVKVLLSDKNSLAQVLCDSALHKIRVIAFDAETTSVGTFTKLQQEFADVVTRENRELTLLAVENPVKVLRAKKFAPELALLSDAAALGSRGFDYICESLRLGVSEIELARALEIFWLKNGGEGLAFDPIIAFGENSSMPHYRSGSRCLKDGDIVLIDIGVKRQRYHSDMTRTVFFGTPDPRLLEIYEVVARAQRAALDLCCPGVTAGQIDAAARDVIAASGYGEFFPHGLGHGVGLEIHELPVLKNKTHYAHVALEVGMVVTVEPGIYLPGLGGVRLEDSIIITAEGYRDITQRPIVPLILNKTSV
jgi:Xaa-Pro aminopeptidase